MLDFSVTYQLVNRPQTLEQASHIISLTSPKQANVIAHPDMALLAMDETGERLCWIILSYSLNDCWSVGTTEDLQLIITGEYEIINKIPCNKFFK